MERSSSRAMPAIGTLSSVGANSTEPVTTPIFGSNDIGMHAVTPYQVIVEWDQDARVWVASSDEVPGLATGADTFEELIEKLKIAIPELLVENGLLPAGTDKRSVRDQGRGAVSLRRSLDGRQFYATRKGDFAGERVFLCPPWQGRSRDLAQSYKQSALHGRQQH